jgi:hypothetical protein
MTSVHGHPVGKAFSGRCKFETEDTLKKMGRGKEPKQGCQMVCFQTENPKLGKFWRVLQWKMLVYFMDTWSRSFVMFD